jgi:hypothetical protein
MATHAGDLDNGSKDHDDSTDDDGFSAAEQISHGKDKHGTYQTTNLIDGCYQTLHG